MYYIGIDLGGTNIVAGVVDDSYKIIAKARVKTNLPRPAEEIVDDMALVAKQATEEAGLKLSDIEWVGV
ncbi:MAG: ROK family protein, partial [Acutalibacteraceae bacterium]|nr:ROK family protein [Acutalibacteraceae bacterium]